MNAINLITSTLALGAMMGISGTHFHQVKTMMAQGGVPMSTPLETQATLSTIEEVAPSLMIPVSLTSATAEPPQARLAPGPAMKAAAASLDARESALMEILREIRKDQQNIRRQVSETNRDMDELTFRVDSHSTQFRPMQVESVRPRALILQEDDSRLDDLLPPKR